MRAEGLSRPLILFSLSASSSSESDVGRTPFSSELVDYFLLLLLLPPLFPPLPPPPTFSFHCIERQPQVGFLLHVWALKGFWYIPTRSSAVYAQDLTNPTSSILFIPRVPPSPPPPLCCVSLFKYIQIIKPKKKPPPLKPLSNKTQFITLHLLL